MPFKPGQSGNPGGRPKIDPTVTAQLRDLLPEAVNRLAAILADPDHPDHFRAVLTTLDRTLGKPTQTMELSASTDPVCEAAQIRDALETFDRLLEQARIGDRVAMTEVFVAESKSYHGP